MAFELSLALGAAELPLRNLKNVLTAQSQTSPFHHYTTNAGCPRPCAYFFHRTNVENYLHTFVLKRKGKKQIRALCTKLTDTRLGTTKRVCSQTRFYHFWDCEVDFLSPLGLMRVQRTHIEPNFAGKKRKEKKKDLHFQIKTLQKWGYGRR